MNKLNIILEILKNNIKKKLKFFHFFKIRNTVDNWVITYLLYSSIFLLIYDLINKKIFKKVSTLNFPTKYKNGYICYRPISDFTNFHDERLYSHLAYTDYMSDFKKYYNYNINIKENDIVIDIGAHIGTFSVYLAQLFLKSKIFIVEADDLNYNLIKKSVKANKLNNVKISNKAAYCKSNEKITFSKGLASTTGSIESIDFFKKSKKALTSEVETISLIDIFKNNNIEKCKILKIDCEGCEYDLLKNTEALNLLSKVEYLFIELHKTKNKEPTQLLNDLKLLNFEIEGNFHNEYAWELFCINKKYN